VLETGQNPVIMAAIRRRPAATTTITTTSAVNRTMWVAASAPPSALTESFHSASRTTAASQPTAIAQYLLDPRRDAAYATPARSST